MNGGRRPGAGRPKGSVTRRVRLLRARILKDEVLSVESTVEAIRRGMSYDVRCLYRPDGTLKPLTELTEAEAWPIVSIDVVRVNVAGGDGHTDTVIKYRLEGRRGFVELAARHQGMLQDKVELSLDEALMAALQAGRQRVLAGRNPQNQAQLCDGTSAGDRPMLAETFATK